MLGFNLYWTTKHFSINKISQQFLELYHVQDIFHRFQEQCLKMSKWPICKFELWELQRLLSIVFSEKMPLHCFCACPQKYTRPEIHLSTCQVCSTLRDKRTTIGCALCPTLKRTSSSSASASSPRIPSKTSGKNGCQKSDITTRGRFLGKRAIDDYGGVDFHPSILNR